MNFRMGVSIFSNNVIGTLIEIALNLSVAVGKIDILTIQSLVYGHRISFHLCMSSLVSFRNVRKGKYF